MNELHKYIIGTVDTKNKVMTVVEYQSRANILQQAQLMNVHFPTQAIIKDYLNDFDQNEKTTYHYVSLRRTLSIQAETFFLFSEVDDQWMIFNPKVSCKLIKIYQQSPEFEDIFDRICSCMLKKNPNLKAQYDQQQQPTEKMIYTSSGYERYCQHCHGYDVIDNFYQNRSGKSFESVCKTCYITHYKPYKLSKRYQQEIQNMHNC